MNENEQNPQLKEVENEISVHHDRTHHGKRIHHSWIFWVGVLLVLAAILYYIVSLNFLVAP